jgi:anti-anti-sigma factor
MSEQATSGFESVGHIRAPGDLGRGERNRGRSQLRQLSSWNSPQSVGPWTKLEFLDQEMVTLSIEGEIDLGTSAQLETELLAALSVGMAVVVLDLSKCGFLDCSVLAVLVRASKHLSGTGTRFSLIVPRKLLTGFELTGLDLRFEIHPTRAAALTKAPRRRASPPRKVALAVVARPEVLEPAL